MESRWPQSQRQLFGPLRCLLADMAPLADGSTPSHGVHIHGTADTSDNSHPSSPSLPHLTNISRCASDPTTFGTHPVNSPHPSQRLSHFFRNHGTSSLCADDPTAFTAHLPSPPIRPTFATTRCTSDPTAFAMLHTTSPHPRSSSVFRTHAPSSLFAGDPTALAAHPTSSQPPSADDEMPALCPDTDSDSDDDDSVAPRPDVAVFVAAHAAQAETVRSVPAIDALELGVECHNGRLEREQREHEERAMRLDPSRCEVILSTRVSRQSWPVATRLGGKPMAALEQPSHSPSPSRPRRRRVHFDHTADASVRDDEIDGPAITQCDQLRLAPELDRMYSYAHSCSGIHSPHYSWEPLGFTCRYTCEANDDLAKIGHALNGKACYSDLEVLHQNDCPPVAVHIAGTPCQSHSKNGSRDGIETAGGMLIVVFARIHRQLPWLLRPIITISENVHGLIHTQRGSTLRIVHRELELSGYVPFDYVLEALDYGAYSKRLRVYVIGIRRDVFEILGPLPTPPTVVRNRAAQAVGNVLGPPTAANEIFDIAKFSAVPTPVDDGDVRPRMMFTLPDGDQNGNVHSLEHPAPCIRSLDSPGIHPFGLYYQPASATTPAVIFAPTESQALQMMSLPKDAMHTGRFSIGNSFDGCVTKALGAEVHRYLGRLYSYLRVGRSDDSAMSCLSAESAACLQSSPSHPSPALTNCVALFVSDGHVYWLVDSGCTYTIVRDPQRIRNPRDCRIPIKIGNGQVMYATSYGDADIVTLDSAGKPIRLVSHLTLLVPGAARELLSQEQIIKQNDLGLLVDIGGARRHFFDSNARQIPVAVHDGLPVIPILPVSAPPPTEPAPTDPTSLAAPCAFPAMQPTAAEPQALTACPATRSPIISPATSAAGAFTANVVREPELDAPLSSEPSRTNYQSSYSKATKSLAHISTCLGVSQSWINKAHRAGIPGAIKDSSKMSDADEARDAQLASAAGQVRKSSRQDARDIRTPSQLGYFTVDYVGPFAIPTLEGATGCHEFLELLTGMAMIVLVTNKGDFVSVLRRVLIRYVYPFILAMLCLTTDVAKEYGAGTQGSAAVIQFCKEAYIKLRHIAPRTPNHNDTERLHQTLTRIMLRLMIQAGTPEQFWGLARLMALEIYLCMPSERATRYKGYVSSPRHAYTGSPEDLSHIHPFGCLCHVLNDSATITMRHLQRHGTASILVGVGRTEGVEYYSCWVPSENHLHQTRNVRFHDRIFPLVDGSLLWDPVAIRGTWRIPLYGHLEPVNPGRASNLRLNPNAEPSPLDPFFHRATQKRGYTWLQPSPDDPHTQPIAKRGRSTRAVAPPLADPTAMTDTDTPTPLPTPVAKRGAIHLGDGVTTLDRLIQSDAPIIIPDTSHKTRGSKSDQRFEAYRHSTTVRELLANGARRADVANDITKGLIRLADSTTQALLFEHISGWESYLERSEITDPAGVFSDLHRHHTSSFNNAHALAAARLLGPPPEPLLRAIAASTGSRLVSHRKLAVENLISQPRQINGHDPSPPTPPTLHVEAWPMLARPHVPRPAGSLSMSAMAAAITVPTTDVSELFQRGTHSMGPLHCSRTSQTARSGGETYWETTAYARGGSVVCTAPNPSQNHPFYNI